VHFFEKDRSDRIDGFLSTVSLLNQSINRSVDLLQIRLLELPLNYCPDFIPEL
jgi:hypothetical protein